MVGFPLEDFDWCAVTWSDSNVGIVHVPFVGADNSGWNGHLSAFGSFIRFIST